MGSFQQHLLVFTALAFSIAVTPAFSVLGWDERYLPEMRLCWDEINKADGCGHDLYVSVLTKKIDVGFKCCEAIQSMDSKCMDLVFNRGRFTAEFGNEVKSFCASFGVTLPPTDLIYYPDGDHYTPGHGDSGQ